MRRADPARSHVLLIGSAHYASPDLDDVPEIDANVPGLQEVLTDPGLGGLSTMHCHRLPADADVSDAITLIEDVAKWPEDLLLIYFAGHGLLGRQGELYLSLSGTRPDKLRATALPYEAIREACLDSPAANRVVILDCCYAGGAIRDVLADADTAILGQVSIAGTYTLAAAGRYGSAVVVAGEANTAFTGRLLTLLRNGVPDADELLSLDEIYRHLHARLMHEGLPRPVQRNTDTVGQLGLVRNAWFDFDPGRPPGPPPVPATVHTAAARLAEAIRDAEHLGPAEPIRAAQIYSEVVDQQQRRRGTHDPATLRARVRHAYFTGAAGRHSDAASLYRDVIADMELVLGPVHHDVLAARVWSAHMRGESGDHAGATRSLGELVASLEHQHAAVPELLNARRLHAWQLAASGHADQAEAILRALITESSRQLGTDHETTLLARRDLARQFNVRDEHGEAIRLLSQLGNDFARVFGPDNYETLYVRLLHCDALAADGHHATAARVLEPLVETLAAVAPERASTLHARLRLATTRQATGLVHEAYADLLELTGTMTRVLGPHDPRTLESQQALAATAYAIGNAAKAAETLRILLPELERLSGPIANDTLDARQMLANSLYDTGEYSQAADIAGQIYSSLESSVMGVRRQLGWQSTQRDEPFEKRAIAARVTFARAWLRSGDRNLSVEQLEPLIRDLTAHGAEAAIILELRRALADAVAGTGDSSRAADEFTRLYADASLELGDSDSRVVELRRGAGLILTAAGRHSEAIAMLQATTDLEITPDVVARRALVESLWAAGRIRESVFHAYRLVTDLGSSGGSASDRWRAQLQLSRHLWQADLLNESLSWLDSLISEPELDPAVSAEAKLMRGQVLAQAGQHAESYQEIEGVTAELRRLYGASSEYLVTASWVAAYDLHRLNRWQAAAKSLDAGLPEFKRVFGSNDQLTLDATLMLAESLGESGRRFRAGEVLRDLTKVLHSQRDQNTERIQLAHRLRRRYYTAQDALLLAGLILWYVVKWSAIIIGIGIYAMGMAIAELVETFSRLSLRPQTWPRGLAATSAEFTPAARCVQRSARESPASVRDNQGHQPERRRGYSRRPWFFTASAATAAASGSR